MTTISGITAAEILHLTMEKNNKLLFFSIKNDHILYIIDPTKLGREEIGLVSFSAYEIEENYPNTIFPLVSERLKKRSIDEIYVIYLKNLSLSYLLSLGTEWRLLSND